jgi:IS30 family transposase
VDQVKLVNGKRIYTHDYYAETGQLIYERHRIVSQAKGKFLKVETFIHYVTKHILEDKWSPDAAVGRFKQEAEHQQEAMVCTKTLYH